MGSDEIKPPEGFVLDAPPEKKQAGAPKGFHVNPGNTQPHIKPEPGLEQVRLPFLPQIGNLTQNEALKGAAVQALSLLPVAKFAPSAASQLPPVYNSLTMEPLREAAQTAPSVLGPIARRIGGYALNAAKAGGKKALEYAGLGTVGAAAWKGYDVLRGKK